MNEAQSGRRRWFSSYLLVMGSSLMLLGAIVSFRAVAKLHSWFGFIVGVVFMLYGFFRLRSRSSLL